MRAPRLTQRLAGLARVTLLTAGLVLATDLQPGWGDPLRYTPLDLNGTVLPTASNRVGDSSDCPDAIQSRSESITLSTRFRHDLISSDFTLSRGALLAANRFDEFAAEDKDRVSVSRAALLSLALPGAGQWYAGARGRAAVFLSAEGLCWAAVGFFETVGQAKKNDFRVYASVHAGIDPAGKGDDFYRTITFYNSREEYNTLGRAYDPRKPYYNDVPDWRWQWDSEASRFAYRVIRNQSNEAFNRVKFSVGALVLNRVISAIDAIRTARGVNRRARMETGDWKIHIKGNPLESNPRFAVMFSREF